MMQHQYWVTKKTVLKKLGTKEDECIVSSDAELDAKLELFRSISDSCLQLQRVLDQYQERLCVLAQEENSLGKFLRDSGKNSDAAGKHMVSAGKAVSYSGQQRLSVRGPLLRLYHEVETFRGRAVSDMRATVSAMEKARIEYRAALSWMKSTSAQLDPDTGRGLDSFRKAQRQVRESKKVFDKLTLDVLQKIDLLAAARCNMFSHVLTNYQSSFLTFATKVSQTLLATADTMNAKPHYEFCILKELSQNLGEDLKPEDVVPQDKDQMLFFQDEYKDDNDAGKTPVEQKEIKKTEEPETNKIEALTESVSLIDVVETTEENAGVSADLAGLRMDCGDVASNFGMFMPSQLLQNVLKSKINQKKEDKAAWFKLFAELDPLANPDSLLGSNNNQIFRGLFTEESPTKVLEVRSDNYISRPIHYREDSMLLYGPKFPMDTKNSKDKYFEIILHKQFTESTHQMYRLQTLASKTAATLNVYNKQGYTPLHMACLANAPDCVRALLLAGADQDMKYGGTPLHWSTSREVIEALVDKNCDINSLNFDGRTALHIMVLRGRLDCATALLSRGADHSITDNEGNTPLHLAVKQTNISIVEALIIFGVDLEALNNAGYTARHLMFCRSSGVRAGLLPTRGLQRGPPPHRAPLRHALLCLDGGGIRGLVLVQILINLEAAIGRPIIHCFDWVAGTSTGGILALALASGKTLRECQRLYFRMKEYAFVGLNPLSKVNDYDVFKPESVWGMAKLAWGLTSIGKLLVDQSRQQRYNE
ncbi:hypothetical protein MSG28_005021 [Choristoneura fumiferana]|uniref:Uncharacterized protein n=1 Tax=Choristoneura fumiferana TaxID=7141 RepID=A0ACC0JQ87_CHOFU|nr:hypothetical protein MSG28_005021 [Choristoneura fumiferana]